MKNNHKVILNGLASLGGLAMGSLFGYWLQMATEAIFIEPEALAEVMVIVVCGLLGMLTAYLSDPAGRWQALQVFILFSSAGTAVAFAITTPGFFTFVEMNGLGYAIYELIDRTIAVWVAGATGMLSVYLYRLLA